MPRAIRLNNHNLMSSPAAAAAAAWLLAGSLAISPLAGQTAFAQDQPAQPAQPAQAQPEQAQPEQAQPDPAAAKAAKAWEEMSMSAQTKLQGATSQEEAEKILQGVLGDLIAFADEYPKSNEAAMALLNHGALAGQLGRYDEAESSLKRAKTVTQDPQLIEAIEMQIDQMSIRPGKTPPAFTATTLAGEKVSPKDLIGKVVLLDFWATWCGPCIGELPNVQRVYKENHDKGFEIVSISLDRDEQTLRDFLGEQELPWIHVFNPAQPPEQDVARKYFISAIPTMILIGRDGKIAEIGMRGPALETAVETALTSPPPAQSAAPVADHSQAQANAEGSR